MKIAVEKHNYSSLDVARLSCNGMAIDKFAKMYRGNANELSGKAVKVFSFDNEMQNIEADICIAAASSNEKYAAIKQGLTKPKSYFKSIMCNGVPLDKFAKKFGNKKFRIYHWL